MNFIKRFFQNKIWVVQMQIRYENRTVHKFPVTVEARWKWQAKDRAKASLILLPGDTRKAKKEKKNP